ncbi:hypothetical protein OBBRIDRAFT_792445 [Obba rivulosa]|uniref:Uncharacterized protein n=1 Tax=Obba rivulosa TaxID=1052685 RepID=A0A8E2AVU0_9APHY|nr:hypothetical protein OBBRIDRAFT_792445 [Obba rivulosa]
MFIGTLLMMRTYALYGRDRRILLVLTTPLAGLFAAGCWAIFAPGDGAGSPVPWNVGCTTTSSNAQRYRFMAAWIDVLVCDVVVFLLTFLKSFRVIRVDRRTLFDIFLRDGAIYFAFLAASNLSNDLTYIYGGLLIRGVAAVFTNNISAVLISRLMLNLRDPKILTQQGTSELTTNRTSHFPISDLEFANGTALSDRADDSFTRGGDHDNR